MKKLIILLISILIFQSSSSFAQYVYPELITPLPNVLIESSGVEVNNINSIWTHNDSGDEARIFNIDTSGNLLRTLYLAIDTAIDCEDITQDFQGNYYLGDFGNNLNNRTDLRIYKIPNPDSILTDSVVPQIISFIFPDQILFPPDSSDRNFDCEAMFHFNDSLYLFSKNRGSSTFCRMYRLPDQPGNYTAMLVDSFNTGSWVTSADISPSGKTIALLSETRIWLFSGYTHTDFFGGSTQILSMNISQKEAIVFVDDTLVYITDEKFLDIGGNLYSLNLAPWINSIKNIVKSSDKIFLFPNPANNEITCSLSGGKSYDEIEIYSLSGELKLKCANTNKVNISTLTPAVYLARIIAENKLYIAYFVKK